MAGHFYVLLSFKDKKTYSGSTDNLERRFVQHKNGKVNSTKNRLPLKLIYKEEYKTLKEARCAENIIKAVLVGKNLRKF